MVDHGDGKPDVDALRERAERFASDVTTTVRAVAGDQTPPFVLQGATGTSGKAAHLVLRQDPADGIVLRVAGRALLRLRVDYRCVWDHAHQYLGVDTSTFEVLAAGISEPLLRYDYVRAGPVDLPSAHLQMHGHRDALTYVMALTGDASRRSRRRARSVDRGVVPRMSELHLPLGGSRFRPSLEDVLEMLVTELGVDAPDGALEALRDRRERWRLHQTAAAVRDSPTTAARVLAELGYQVDAPISGPSPDRSDRLRTL